MREENGVPGWFDVFSKIIFIAYVIGYFYAFVMTLGLSTGLVGNIELRLQIICSMVALTLLYGILSGKFVEIIEAILIRVLDASIPSKCDCEAKNCRRVGEYGEVSRIEKGQAKTAMERRFVDELIYKYCKE